VGEFGARRTSAAPRKVCLFRENRTRRKPDRTAQFPFRMAQPGGSGLLAVSNFQALPSEETRVNRPHARPEEREGGPKSPDHDAVPAILRIRERIPERGYSQENAYDRSPQPDDEERAQAHTKHMKERRFERRSATEAADPVSDRSNSGDETDQK
jgi:hypothetical protein